MKKTKKGSALVMVLLVFSILTILGIAITTLALSNYKMRILKSNVKTNIYASEAGIDESYGIIGNIIDKAIESGNLAAEDFINSINFQEEIKDRENGGDSPFVNADLSINEEYIKRCQNSEFRAAYVKTILEGNNGNNEIIDKLNDKSSYIFKLEGKEAPQITAELLGEVLPVSDDSFETDKLFTIRISSKSYHKNLEKVLSADYDIYVPKYEDTYYLETNHLKIPKNPVWTKAIAADGNMKVASEKLSVDGDLFIKGNSQDTSTTTPGIEVASENSNISIKGKISTWEDFSISSNSTCNIIGDIFSKNLLINKEAEGSKLIVSKLGNESEQNDENNETGSVYTNDDLEINAPNAKVEIRGGFYGLSDGSNSSKADESSSININVSEITGDGSIACDLKILGESIIMGSSYVDAVKINTNEDRYQTGESLSIKGNYKAYTYPLKDSHEGKEDLKEDNVIFDYYKPIIPNSNIDLPPITFVSQFKNGNDLNVFDKSRYFKYYSEEYGEDNPFKWKGVYVNPDEKKSIHVGSIISDNGNVVSGNYVIDDKAKLDLKIDKFNNMLYRMGSGVNLGKNLTVNDQINLQSIPKGINQYDSSEGTVILINDDKEYTLVQGDASSSDNDIVLSSNKGIIISNGNLNIKGKFDFTGTIITKGSINIQDNLPKSIIYEESVVKNLIGLNYNILKDIFVNNLPNEYAEVQLDPKIVTNPSIKSTIKKDKLIKMNNWTIVK